MDFKAMTTKGFTLLELLVVVGIMGLLGTVSIGGYRAITRGMEERGAVQNASQFMHAALQRAMIDRQPTAVYMWNETLRSRSDDEGEIVVGKAVAVRRAGRISRVNGNELQDEFADLNLTYGVAESQEKSSKMYLYKFRQNGIERSRVYDTVRNGRVSEMYLLDPPDGSQEGNAGNLPAPGDGGVLAVYGFVCEAAGSWRAGDPYGFEFMSLELPKNYIFGNNYSPLISDPIREAGVIVFGGGGGGYEQRGSNTSGTKTVDIYAVRQNKSGDMSADTKVGTTEDPTQEAR